MTYPIPSGTHQVGDTGHTADHDSIITVLTQFLADITGLKSVTGNIFYTVGGNVNNIPGTATSWATVNLPSGNRDAAADTLDVFYGVVKVFSLNGYGEIRLAPGAAAHIPAIIQGLPGQSGDLLQFRNSSGQVIARVAPDGTLTAQAVTAYAGTAQESWHAASLASGWANTGVGPAAKYRLLAAPPDSVEIIGDISGGTLADNTVLFTLPGSPVSYRPNTQQLVCPILTPAAPGSPVSMRIFAMTSGAITIDGISGLPAGSRIGFHGIVSLDA